MKKEIAPSHAKSDKIQLAETNVAVQRLRLLQALRTAGSDGITTIQARHELNIMAPAPRIFELRHQLGKNIQTVWTNQENPEGHPHRCARYILFPGKMEGTRNV